MRAHPFALALERRFPGLFEFILVDDDDDNADMDAGAEPRGALLDARARSLSGDPGVDLTAHFGFGEYSVGIGCLAHTHYDNNQLADVLDLIEPLASGSLGCFETLGFDGSPRSARMIDFADAQSGNIPALGPKDKSFRIRFFTGLGDMDGAP